MTTAVKLHFDTASCFCERCNCGVLPLTTAVDGDKTKDDDRDTSPRRFRLSGGTGGFFDTADIKQ